VDSILVHMTLNNALNNTSGRFTTLVVGNKNDNQSYCAQIISASDKTVSFRDVNSDTNRRVPASKILSVKSGRTSYSRAWSN